MRCKYCNEKFDKMEASELFNDYFDGKHDYFYEAWDDACAECAISYQESIDEEGQETDGPPPGCNECGGDYPNCVDSCPLYDD